MASLEFSLSQTLKKQLTALQERLPSQIPFYREGRLTRMIGLTLEAVGLKAEIGAECEILNPMGQSVRAEVVGFSGEKIYLMPFSATDGLTSGARIIPLGHSKRAPVGDQLLGRVLSGEGIPIDGKGPLNAYEYRSLTAPPINPLSRSAIDRPLNVGIRAINSLLTVGRGQRIGLFAGSGVGKSILLGMMARYTEADVTVVGLIGERGREVKEFIEKILGPEGLKRSIVVASPADSPPLMRLHGAMLATSIAEYFRDQGKHVLLLMDSLTRFAQAQREIALGIGEPPATKGYTPSVFAKLPALVERAGATSCGSITGFYTVLAEGDDQQDPIADASRAILDGHIVLSRHLADAGHYPAIDVALSISRVMPDIVSAEHLALAMRFKQLYADYQQNRDLLLVGAYQKGSDPTLDQAIEMNPKLKQFLKQGFQEAADFESALKALQILLGMPHEAI